MKQWPVRILVGILGSAFACGAVLAKLPAPEPSEEAKAAAAATAAKAPWSSKVGAYKLCLAQEKAVAHYMAGAQSAGKAVTPATPTPACADPGPYVVAAVEPAKPVDPAKAAAAAAAAAAKAAWSSKVGAYKLCLAQDKAVAHYTASAQSGGKAATPAAPAPACADPGPFVVAAVEPAKPVEVAKPVETAGAPAPAATATIPSSTKQPDAAVNPAVKP